MILTYQKLLIMKQSNPVEAIAVEAMRYRNGNLLETLKSMYNNNPPNISFDEDVFRRHLQDVLPKLYENVQKHLQDILKDVFRTSSRHLEDVLLRSLQDVFKTLSRRLAKIFPRHLQDILKASSRRLVKMF